MSDTFTHTRRSHDGDRLIPVVNHRPGAMSRHEPKVRRLAWVGHTDPEIGQLLGLTSKQVQGIRKRADPPIPSARTPGRPKGAKDRVPRRRPGSSGDGT